MLVLNKLWNLPSPETRQIRVVFNSSAQYKNLSFNNILLQVPNLNNSLVRMLACFRDEPVAVMSDIQQMFQSFLVREYHRNYLWFICFLDYNLDSKVMECHMKVNVFGNCPWPAMAIYGMKRTASEGDKAFGVEARDFVVCHF